MVKRKNELLKSVAIRGGTEDLIFVVITCYFYLHLYVGPGNLFRHKISYIFMDFKGIKNTKNL